MRHTFLLENRLISVYSTWKNHPNYVDVFSDLTSPAEGKVNCTFSTFIRANIGATSQVALRLQHLNAPKAVIRDIW